MEESNTTTADPHAESSGAGLSALTAETMDAMPIVPVTAGTPEVTAPPTIEAPRLPGFVYNDDGTPKLNSKKKHMKERGRPRKVELDTSEVARSADRTTPDTTMPPAPTPFVEGGPGARDPKADRAAAEMFAGTVIDRVEMVTADNPLWQFRETENASEKALMHKSLTDYLATKPIGDLPPGYALALAVGLWAMPRLSQSPAVQRFIMKIVAKVRGVELPAPVDEEPIEQVQRIPNVIPNPGPG